MKTTAVRGVIIKDYLVFPFSDDYAALLKARIPMLRVKAQGIKTVRQLLTAAGYQLVTKDWTEIQDRLCARLAEAIDGKAEKTKFTVINESEDVVRDAVEKVREEMSRYSHRAEFKILRKGISKSGKILRNKPDAPEGVWGAQITCKFDPEMEIIDGAFAAAAPATHECELVVGHRKLILAHMPPLRSMKSPYLHLRVGSVNPEDTENDILASSENVLTPETKLAIKSFALQLLTKFA